MPGMGIGMRELMLRLQARGFDQAVAQIEEVSGGLASMGKAGDASSFKMLGVGIVMQRVGRGMTALGQKVVGLGIQAGKMAIDFNEGMAQVQTQAQLGQKAFQRLSDDTLKAIADFPRAADEMTQGLFDIFSSLDVNGKQGIKLLREFAAAATAGGTDIRTTARGAIAELNAFQLPIKDSTHLLDIQFQMVRKGVGTYQEFVSALGNIVSAARASGQTLESMSGALAFATRTGMSTSMASISVARALDLLMRHRGDIKDVLGIDVVDKATGQYRQLGDIMLDFQKKFQGLTQPQMAAKLKAIFSAGEIRANRFFRVAIPGAKNLNEMIASMGGSQVAGQMQKAFNIMMNTPANQWRQLTNEIKATAIAIANAFLPTVSKVIGYIKQLVDWFSALSPHTKDLIARIVLIGGAFSLVSGKIFTFVGGLIQSASMLRFVGVSLKGFMGIMGGTQLLIIALAAAAFLIIKNWGTLKKWFEAFTKWWKEHWDIIKTVLVVLTPFIAVWIGNFLHGFTMLTKAATSIIGVIQKFGKAIIGVMADIGKALLANPWLLLLAAIVAVVVLIILHWKTVKAWTIRIWNDVFGFLKNLWGSILSIASSVWNAVVDFFVGIWNSVKDFVVNTWTAIVNELKSFWRDIHHGIIGPEIRAVVAIIKVGFTLVKDIIIGLWLEIRIAIKIAWIIIMTIIRLAITFIKGYIIPAWTFLATQTAAVWKLIWTIISSTWDLIRNDIILGLTIIRTLFLIAWDVIKNTVGAAWHFIFATIKMWVTIIINFVGIFLDLIRGRWGAAWHKVLNILKSVWQMIKATVNLFFGNIWNIIVDILGRISSVWHTVWNRIKGIASGIWDSLKGLVKGAINFIHDTISNVIHTIATVWRNTWTGIQSIFSGVWGGIKGLAVDGVNFVIRMLNTLIHAANNAAEGIANVLSFGFANVPNIPDIPQVGNQAGNAFWRGGIGLVGEAGRELVYMPRGTRIIPNKETEQILASTQKGTTTLQFYGIHQHDAEETIRAIEWSRRTTGW